MNMPEKLYNTLKEKLGEEKVTLDGKEMSVLDLIAGDEGLWKLSKEVLPKVKDNNADLVKQREDWEKKEKTYKDDLKSKDGEIDKLKTGQLTEDERKEWLKIKEKGMTSDVEAKFNAQADTVKTLTDSITALKEEIETEKSNRVNASKEGALQKMRNFKAWLKQLLNLIWVSGWQPAHAEEGRAIAMKADQTAAVVIGRQPAK